MRRLADALRALRARGAAGRGRRRPRGRAPAYVRDDDPAAGRSSRATRGSGRAARRAARRGRAAAGARRRLLILLGAMLALRRRGAATGCCTSTGTSTSATPAGRAGSAPSRARTWRASPGGSEPALCGHRRAVARTCPTPTPSTSASASATPASGRRSRAPASPSSTCPRCARTARCARRCRTGCTSTPTCSTLARGRLPRAGRAHVRGAAALLRELVAGAVGVQVTVFDPDLDADGSQARALTDCLVAGLRS